MTIKTPKFAKPIKITTTTKINANKCLLLTKLHLQKRNPFFDKKYVGSKSSFVVIVVDVIFLPLKGCQTSWNIFVHAL